MILEKLSGKRQVATQPQRRPAWQAEPIRLLSCFWVTEVGILYADPGKGSYLPLLMPVLPIGPPFPEVRHCASACLLSNGWQGWLIMATRFPLCTPRSLPSDKTLGEARSGSLRGQYWEGHEEPAGVGDTALQSRA